MTIPGSGRKFPVWLSNERLAQLGALAERDHLSGAEVIRKLITEEYQKEQDDAERDE
jgi:RNA polymerase-interacting CarD/CdnL/TRCF family regulator